MIGFHGKNIMNGKRTGESMKTKPSGQFNPSINRLLSFILSISILLTVAAPFAEPQTVEANWVTRTIGALITSLALQSGAANIDTNYLNYVNDPNNTVMQIEIPNDGGVTSLPADLAQQIDTALETAPASVQRTVGGMGTTQAEIINLQDYLQTNGVPQGSQPSIQPSSIGENIASSARQLQQTGEVQPSIGGQAVGAFVGMVPTVWNYMSSQRNSTLQKGEIIQACIDGKITQQQMEEYLYGHNGWEKYKDQTIAGGVSSNTADIVLMNNVYGGRVCILPITDNQYESYSMEHGLVPYSYIKSGYKYIYIHNFDNVSRNYNYYTISHGQLDTGASGGTYSVAANGNKRILYVRTSSARNYTGVLEFSTEVDAQNWIASQQSIPETYSPSFVGNQGQLNANLNIDPTLNLNYYTTNQAPTYNLNNYTMQPIDLNEYTQFAQSIQQQIASETPQAEISEAIEQYVSQHITAAPIPTTPPVIPDQPTPDPKPTGTPEQQQENQEIMSTPELKDKFPFCIPWDVYYAFAVLEDQREAPALDFDLDLGPAGTHHIEIDFADWEDIASLLRLLELLAFIIGLAIATKRLMGGTGA